MAMEDIVRKYIQQHGINIVRIGRKLDWTPVKAAAFLDGDVKLSADDLDQICEALNLPCGFFYNIAAQRK